MTKPVTPALIALIAAVAAVAAPAWAERPFVVIIRPPLIYNPEAGPQLGSEPYRGQGFTIYPLGGTSLPPQLTTPTFKPFARSSDRTCVAPSFTCAADPSAAQSTPCSCATNDGQSIQGLVR